MRVATRFCIPPATAPGHYMVTYCTGTCDRPAQLGDLIGGFLSVGMDPPVRQSREWPMDEPEIANLADDAVLTGPGYMTTAGAVRAGTAPTRPPFPAPRAVATTATSVVTTVATPPPAPAPALSDAPAGARWESFALAASTATLIAVALLARRRRASGEQGAHRLDARAPVRGAEGRTPPVASYSPESW